MRDPFSWAFPVGRMFGVTVRVHILFPFVALGMIIHAAYGAGTNGQQHPPGTWIDAALVITLLFFSVLLHEFGHIFGARHVNGDGEEVLLWPLGGLARVDVPHTPRANFITAFAGPFVNILLCLLAAGLLLVVHDSALRPSFSIMGYTGRGTDGLVGMDSWAGDVQFVSPYSAAALLGWLFWVNYILFLFNMVLVGFPMDAGRILQSILWPYMGYRQATLTAVFAGFITVFVVGVFAIVTNETLAVFLAIFIYVTCRQEWFVLETGGEEGIFGYDFSQGYTSLERDDEERAPRKPRESWWKRWKQRRAERRAQREQEQREAEERRMDELLNKISQQGMEALTDEERRFMRRVSDRYRENRP